VSYPGVASGASTGGLAFALRGATSPCLLCFVGHAGGLGSVSASGLVPRQLRVVTVSTHP
jgi:hypothetical protein